MNPFQETLRIGTIQFINRILNDAEMTDHDKHSIIAKGVVEMNALRYKIKNPKPANMMSE